MNSSLSRPEDTDDVQLTGKRRRVLDGLEELMAAVGPSGLLPSERELAPRFGVSRPTLRSVLTTLRDDGRLDNAHGRGWIVIKAVAPVTRATSRSILLAAPQISGAFPRTPTGSDFAIIGGAAAACDARDWNAVTISPGRLTGEQVEALLHSGTSGAVFFWREDIAGAIRRAIEQFLRAGCPVVVYGSGNELDSYDRVVSDHVAGAHALTQLLIEQGCRRILRWQNFASAQLSIPPWLLMRNYGHEQAMRKAGADPLPPLTYHEPSESGLGPADFFEVKVELAVRHLKRAMELHGDIDALMLNSDGPGFTLAAACRRLGIHPGTDLLIAGYDNYWKDSPEAVFCEFRPFATVDKHNARLGAAAVDLLQRRIDGSLIGPVVLELVSPQVIITDPARVTMEGTTP